jgi:hypothetical protein
LKEKLSVIEETLRREIMSDTTLAIVYNRVREILSDELLTNDTKALVVAHLFAEARGNQTFVSELTRLLKEQG